MPARDELLASERPRFSTISSLSPRRGIAKETTTYYGVLYAERDSSYTMFLRLIVILRRMSLGTRHTYARSSWRGCELDDFFAGGCAGRHTRTETDSQPRCVRAFSFLRERERVRSVLTRLETKLHVFRAQVQAACNVSFGAQIQRNCPGAWHLRVSLALTQPARQKYLVPVRETPLIDA